MIMSVDAVLPALPVALPVALTAALPVALTAAGVTAKASLQIVAAAVTAAIHAAKSRRFILNKRLRAAKIAKNIIKPLPSPRKRHYGCGAGPLKHYLLRGWLEPERPVPALRIRRRLREHRSLLSRLTSPF